MQIWTFHAISSKKYVSEIGRPGRGQFPGFLCSFLIYVGKKWKRVDDFVYKASKGHCDFPQSTADSRRARMDFMKYDYTCRKKNEMRICMYAQRSSKRQGFVKHFPISVWKKIKFSSVCMNACTKPPSALQILHSEIGYHCPLVHLSITSHLCWAWSAGF